MIWSTLKRYRKRSSRIFKPGIFSRISAITLMHALGIQTSRTSERTDKVIGLGWSPVRYGTIKMLYVSPYYVCKNFLTDLTQQKVYRMLRDILFCSARKPEPAFDS